MKWKLNNKYSRWGVTAFLVIVATICFYYVMFHLPSLLETLSSFLQVLMPISFGLGTAYLLTPILNQVERKMLIPLCNKCKIKDTVLRRKTIRGIGILLTSVFVFVIIYILFAMLLSQIVPSIQNIIQNFDVYLENIIAWIDDLLANNADIKDYVVRTIDKYSIDFEQWLNENILSKTSSLIKTVSMSVLSTVGVLWDFIVGFIIAIYVLSMKETLSAQSKKVIYAIFKRDTANVLINNIRFTHKTFIGFVGGKIVDSLIIGVLCFIGTSILKTPYAALVSVIIGVTNIIPFFGPFLGAIPTGILVFVVDPMNPLTCVYFLLFILALQQFDGNVLGPKILGNSTGISGFWVIFAITLFGGIMGIPGMVIGVPLFAVIYAIIKSKVVTSLRKKGLSVQTEDYRALSAIDEDGTIQNEDSGYYACKGKRFYSSKEDIDIDLGKHGEEEVETEDQLCAKPVEEEIEEENEVEETE